MTTRRGFLQAILAAGVAPYVCTTAGVLMPVRSRELVVPDDWYSTHFLVVPPDETLVFTGAVSGLDGWVRLNDELFKITDATRRGRITVSRVLTPIGYFERRP